MAAGSYEIWYTDDKGVRIALLDNALGGIFNKNANGIGFFELPLPGSFDTSLLKRDRMIQVWRAPIGGTLSVFRVYFLRWWQLARIESDLRITLKGPDVNDLMRRRHVINYSGTAGASKTDLLDDLMKEVVDEQAINDASDPTSGFGIRDIPDFTNQVDVSAGPLLSFAMAWRKLSEWLPDASRAGRAESNEVFWDIVEQVTSNSIALQFQTKTGQPGQDLTSSVIFDEARGNLSDSSLTLDYFDEVNYVYGLGQGQSIDRNVQQQWDADRMGASRYNRCEGIAFAANAEIDDTVREAARERLTNGLPRRILTGRLVDTEGTQFGRDWNWGDKIRARFLGIEFDAIIRKLTITLDGNMRETIDAPIESEDVIS